MLSYLLSTIGALSEKLAITSVFEVMTPSAYLFKLPLSTLCYRELFTLF